MFGLIFGLVGFIASFIFLINLGWADLYPDDMLVISIFMGLASLFPAGWAMGIGLRFDEKAKHEQRKWRFEQQKREGEAAQKAAEEKRERLAKEQAARKEEARLKAVAQQKEQAAKWARQEREQKKKEDVRLQKVAACRDELFKWSLVYLKKELE